MAFFYSNLVISTRQVKSTEHLRFTKLIKQVMDTRDWKHVEACLFIQASKVNTHLKEETVLYQKLSPHIFYAYQRKNLWLRQSKYQGQCIILYILVINDHCISKTNATHTWAKQVIGMGGHCVRSWSVGGPQGKYSWQDSCGLQLDPPS